MTALVVTIDADADLHDAFALLRTHAVRRLAVVRGAQFVGMVTLDDLLIDLAADLSDIARPEPPRSCSPTTTVRFQPPPSQLRCDGGLGGRR